MGHTHDQGHLSLDKFEGLSGRIINPGSLGAPYHEDAKYAVYDSSSDSSTLHRAYYDDSAIRERFDQLGMKSAEELQRSEVY
jgi:diadenosine tetraphosphatase ApaH/serine/threonine PP2A family protein phosphatase